MKKCIALFAVLLLMLPEKASAQHRFETAIEYLNFISGYTMLIEKDMMEYTAAVAHDKRARKIENKRQALLNSMDVASKEIAYMAPFKGDKSFRDTVLATLKLRKIVLVEDYAKILNLEDIAEQSYDAMEAYMLAQKLAQEKINANFERLKVQEKKFAEQYDITLVEGNNDKLSQKIEVANKVNNYHEPIYLLFFKIYKQDMYVTDAIERANVGAIEQNKATLKKFAEEVTSKLTAVKAFENGDVSLIESISAMIEFANFEVNNLEKITDFFLKKDNFDKLNKKIESMKPRDRTQQDIDGFNKAVQEYNASINDFNTTNKVLFEARSKAINGWNKASQRFLDKYYPK